MAFRLPGDSSQDVFFHTRGTFGIGSAAYWWQRPASTVVRVAHRLGGEAMALWHLLFADDGWLTATGKDFWRKLLFWLFVLECLELPLNWKKVAGGTVVQWIGYQLDVKDFRRGISQKKVDWINKWIDEKVAAGGITGRELRSALGRPSFEAIPESFVQDYFRIDAKAEQDKIVIGGWETCMSKDTRRARWLSVKLGRKEIPWAYLKIEPFRSIATLELVGVLLAVMFWKGAGWEQSRGVAGLPGLTDNQAITHVEEVWDGLLSSDCGGYGTSMPIGCGWVGARLEMGPGGRRAL